MYFESSLLGNLGELKSQEYFLRLGYEIYTGAVGNHFYDFIAVKARSKVKPVVTTVEVKATTQRNPADTGWVFDIRRSHKYLAFDKTKVDVLCCSIAPLDKVVVLKAQDVKNTRQIVIKDVDLL